MSTMIQPTKNKHGVYILRMAVPSDLRITLGKSEVKRSLKTKELAAAKLNAPAVMAEMQAILQQARRTLQAEQSVTSDDIELVASVWTTKILPQPELIEERYICYSSIGIDLTHDNSQIRRYLDERDSKNSQERNVEILQLMQVEMAEALEWTHIALTPTWRYELAWRLAERRCQAAEMFILDVLPKYSAITKQQPRATSSSSLTFNELFKKYQEHVHYYESDRAENRIKEYSTAANRFIEFIGAKPISDITVEDLASFRLLMEKLPFRPGKVVSNLPLIEQAKMEGKKLSPIRVRNLLMAISAIFEVATFHKLISSNPVRDLPQRKRVQKDNEDTPFTPDEISQIFSTPLFNGESTPHGAMAYWIPIILYYTGARVEEIAQLYKENIIRKNGIDCFSIRMKDGQSTKDGLSRVVPINSHLIELGFLDYVASKERHLFTEEKNPSGKYSYNFRRWFANYIRKHGITRNEIMPTHSFRHTFISYCRDEATREDTQNSITGHSQRSVSRNYGRYLEAKKADIEKIPRLDLQRLDIWSGRAN